MGAIIDETVGHAMAGLVGELTASRDLAFVMLNRTKNTVFANAPYHHAGIGVSLDPSAASGEVLEMTAESDGGGCGGLVTFNVKGPSGDLVFAVAWYVNKGAGPNSMTAALLDGSDARTPAAIWKDPELGYPNYTFWNFAASVSVIDIDSNDSPGLLRFQSGGISVEMTLGNADVGQLECGITDETQDEKLFPEIAIGTSATPAPAT